MISVLCLIIATICLVGIIKAMKTGIPPGQKGIWETELENSKILKYIQVVFLTILMVFAMIGFVYFFKMG